MNCGLYSLIDEGGRVIILEGLVHLIKSRRCDGLREKKVILVVIVRDMDRGALGKLVVKVQIRDGHLGLSKSVVLDGLEEAFINCEERKFSIRSEELGEGEGNWEENSQVLSNWPKSKTISMIGAILGVAALLSVSWIELASSCVRPGAEPAMSGLPVLSSTSELIAAFYAVTSSMGSEVLPASTTSIVSSLSGASGPVEE